MLETHVQSLSPENIRLPSKEASSMGRRMSFHLNKTLPILCSPKVVTPPKEKHLELKFLDFLKCVCYRPSSLAKSTYLRLWRRLYNQPSVLDGEVKIRLSNRRGRTSVFGVEESPKVTAVGSCIPGVLNKIQQILAALYEWKRKQRKC